MAALALCSCVKAEKPAGKPGTGDKPEEETVFAKGADISWVTEMESKGIKFKNSKGEEMECTALMKETGMNAIRLRVWVNPEDGWNSAEDVLEKAERAQALGMRIMINFHYSDSWADPGKQNPPAAWKDYDLTNMQKAVAEHTTFVLNLLKDNGVDVEWVQIGNETTTGMLWPLGNYKQDNGRNFALLVDAGARAAKAVYPDCKTIVHLDKGNEIYMYNEIFTILKNYNVRYDLIGMSLYPCWWDDSIKDFTTNWKGATAQCVQNIRNLSATYGKNIMICETGMPVVNPDIAKEMLTYLLKNSKATGHCEGVFYWEPEASSGYNGGYGLGAFENDMPTAALDAFKEFE